MYEKKGMNIGRRYERITNNVRRKCQNNKKSIEDAEKPEGPCSVSQKRRV